MASSTHSSAGRFLPGTVLQDRYRIIGLLGHGGMGEVYRADDLKLGQPVALKWLRSDMAESPGRLERFLGEVRHSLKVTHPNVCRVYDIGESGGQHYLSMEYVDGEDLASLLRRIGRLPEDKALQIARQLCAGLAAAHSEGVLHRDIKPANVMIDGRGRAKITDFGLAGATRGIEGAEARAGTPGYMAPEQFAGNELSVRTDIYALGLVLYELFTGRPAYEASSAKEMVKLQKSAPSTLSSHINNIDPAIEEVILRCLAVDPKERPESAEWVAMALPGGDPLAAAVAAGETPSPDVIAAIGGRGGLNPRMAWLALIAAFALTALGFYLQAPTKGLDYLKPELSAEVLKNKARDVLRGLNLYEGDDPYMSGFASTSSVHDWFEEQAAERGDRDWISKTTQIDWLRYWYRQRDGSLASDLGYGYTDEFNPPLVVEGETLVVVNHKGELRQLTVVPQDPTLTDAAPVPYDWTPLLESAGLTPECIEPAPPNRVPPDYVDSVQAWNILCEETIGGSTHVVAASLQGMPIYFHVIPPWIAKVDSYTPSKGGFYFELIKWIAVIVLAFVARKNLRSGRSDVRGATAIAVVYLVGHNLTLLPILAITWSNAGQLLRQMIEVAGFDSAFLWIAYAALEPPVRRRWPKVLVAWSRLLQGGVSDPRVGREVLLGLSGGALILAVIGVASWIEQNFAAAPLPPGALAQNVVLDTSWSPFLWIVHQMMHVIEGSMVALAVFVAVTVLLRNALLSIGAITGLMLLLLLLLGSDPSWTRLITIATGMIVFYTLTLRVGFLASTAAILSLSSSMSFVTSFHFGTWYAHSALVALGSIALLTLYMFYTSLAGRPILRHKA